MAKIYETEQDKQRDSANQKLNAGVTFQHVGVNGALLSAIVLALDAIITPLIPKNTKNLLGKNIHVERSKSNWGFAGMGIAALTTAIAGWFVKKQAEKELAALGPEEVVQPAQAADYIAVKSDHAAKILAEQTLPSQPLSK